MNQMGTTTKTLYETDFVEWADTMAALLRAGRLSEIDVENVAEEIESLGKAERKAVRSQLQRLMKHLLKQKIQPERDSRSWRASIENARDEILDDFEEAPSLKLHLEQNIERVYRRAVNEALRETELTHQKAISDRCPWKLDELLTGDLAELARR
jgi:hypothetical protein